MRPAPPTVEPPAGWEIARPARPRLPGVDMAGFRLPGGRPTDLRVIPHPAVTVAVAFGGGAVDVGGGARVATLVAGLGFRAFDVRAGDVECVQVRLSPLIAHRVLGVPLAELRTGVVGLDDLWGLDTARLRDRLHDARAWPERFALVETTLAARLDAGRAVDPEVAWVWRRIVADRGRSRVGDLAARVGWSRQHLSARFGAQLGLSPKRAGMLIRFDHAVHRLVRGHAPAQVAADGGYTDQSHLHHDVRAFTGATPAAAADEPWLAADATAWPGA
ncbi:helix-turn-helix domain-containing protein [Pseudonocardia sp. CA-107938]|uniref:helix-turn-helix domain-containing protein n=1 Tax=Pseudonocardia sp. CA-107938 TaxID=3240021 RepID=UPI003D8C9295